MEGQEKKSERERERASERVRERIQAAMRRTGRRRIKGWEHPESITWVNARARRKEMYSCLKCKRCIGQNKKEKKYRLVFEGHRW